MILFVSWLVLINAAEGAKLLNCPTTEQKFVKTLGLRPSNFSNPIPLYKLEKGVPLRPVTAECIAKCQSNKNCSSFVLLYRYYECYFFDHFIDAFEESKFVIDENAAWFSKTCFSGKTCDKLWIFERIPGATLVGNGTKVLPIIATREECEQYCLNETLFTCRSFKFRIDSDSYDPHAITKGSCILSSTDRHLLPNAYRVSGFNEEYFENQCSRPMNFTQEFCAYEEYNNVTLANSDVVFERKSKEDCQILCEEFKNFNCRGYSILRGNLCYLHSEDSKVFGPTLLKDSPLSTYYEKARCLNISVQCSETYIDVKYNPEVKFYGRMYMQGFSDNPECFAVGEEFHPVILKIPLLTGSCGIIEANSSVNRTLFTGVMIIQYNSIIQTQNDRVIRVGCIFGNNTKVLIGTGIKISTILPNSGSVLVNNSTSKSTSPVVEMRILDFNTHEEIADTQIGQELQLVIEMKKNPIDNYDIWASHLVAMTDKGDESIFLLDDFGCPTDLNIFPMLEKIVTNTSIRLTAAFQAFKFASSPIVRFSVIVEFCVGQCPAINCGNEISSQSKKKRDVSTIHTINGTRVVETKQTNFEERYGTVNELPLEYIMIVKYPKSISDRLIYGDNSKILVAGYDYVKDEVCMNYSLAIGLTIVLLLIQIFFVVGCIILVRRYKRYYQHECMRLSLEELHKNFGIGFSNLDNRRVHWADNDNIM